MEAFYAKQEAKVSAMKTLGLDIEQRIRELNGKIDQARGYLSTEFELTKDLQVNLNCANVVETIYKGGKDEQAFGEMTNDLYDLEAYEENMLHYFLAISKFRIIRNRLLKRLIAETGKAESLSRGIKDEPLLKTDHRMIHTLRDDYEQFLKKFLVSFVGDFDRVLEGAQEKRNNKIEDGTAKVKEEDEGMSD